MKSHHATVVALIVLSISAAATGAELSIKVDDVSIMASAAPVDGFFDVFFQIESPASLPQLSGYSLAIDLRADGAGVTLGAPINPPVAGPHPPVFPTSPPLDFGTTDRVQAAANLPGIGEGVSISHGAGMVRVPYQVAPGTAGVFSLELDLGSTALVDNSLPDGQAIPFTARNGSLVVIGDSIPGDFNLDGNVNALDIDLLRANVGSSDPLFDLDNDGIATFSVSGSGVHSDSDALIRVVLATDYGDANLDRRVNSSDAAILGGSFGAPPVAGWGMGNFTSDDLVNSSDAAVLGGSFGFDNSLPSPIQVPEPSPAVLLMGALGATLLLRTGLRVR